MSSLVECTSKIYHFCTFGITENYEHYFLGILIRLLGLIAIVQLEAGTLVMKIMVISCGIHFQGCAQVHLRFA